MLKATEQCLTHLSRGVRSFPVAQVASCTVWLSVCPSVPSQACVPSPECPCLPTCWSQTSGCPPPTCTREWEWECRTSRTGGCSAGWRSPSGLLLKDCQTWECVGMVAGPGRLFLGGRTSCLGWRQADGLGSLSLQLKVRWGGHLGSECRWDFWGLLGSLGCSCGARGRMAVLGVSQQPRLFCRYTFGSALFVGWVAGGLALVGGIMMCLACKGLVPEESR